MPWLQTNGIDSYYEIHGEGPPLLLIPGRGLDRTSWAPQIPCYAQHFRVISYDPRGVGKTKAGDAGFDITAMSADACALLAALGHEEAHVCGFSLGGMAAIHLATSGQVRVRSLMLHSTVHRAYPHLRLRQRLSLSILDHDDAELWATFSSYTAFGAEYINAHSDVVEAEIERRAKRWQSLNAEEKAGTRAQIVAAMTHDAAELLPRIAAPTLITVGTSDDATRPEYAREMAELIPGARLVVFDGGPHRVSTFMADKFNQVTLGFLLEHK